MSFVGIWYLAFVCLLILGSWILSFSWPLVPCSAKLRRAKQRLRDSDFVGATHDKKLLTLLSQEGISAARSVPPGCSAPARPDCRGGSSRTRAVRGRRCRGERDALVVEDAEELDVALAVRVGHELVAQVRGRVDLDRGARRLRSRGQLADERSRDDAHVLEQRPALPVELLVEEPPGVAQDVHRGVLAGDQVVAVLRLDDPREIVFFQIRAVMRADRILVAEFRLFFEAQRVALQLEAVIHLRPQPDLHSPAERADGREDGRVALGMLGRFRWSLMPMRRRPARPAALTIASSDMSRDAQADIFVCT